MSDTALRITIVAHNVGPIGGMELQLTKLINGLLDRGHMVTVVSRTCQLEEHGGLRWLKVNGPSRPFPLAYPWFFVAASLRVRKSGRGLLHTTGALIVSRSDISTVHLCHHALRADAGIGSISGPRPWHRLNSWLSRVMADAGEDWCYRPRRLRTLVAVSDGVAEELRAFFPRLRESLHIIPLGVESEAFRPNQVARLEIRAELGVGPKDMLAIFVGGNWDLKGLGFAVEGVAGLPQWQLVVVGSGDFARYRALAQSSGAGERMHFVGMRSNTRDYYSAADAFILPSAYETFSLVTHEAAAAGLPLLVTRVSGVEEILTDGHNGWFIERDRTSIATRLRILSDDPLLRAEMGRRSRDAVVGRTWETMVDGYEDLYRQLSTAP